MNRGAAGTGRALVVWYSQGGRTAQLGEELARHLGAVREGIQEVTPACRDGLGGRWRMQWDTLRRRAPPIRATRFRPAEHELVVVGTPVWGAGPAAPIRRYLRDHAGEFHRLAFFAVGADDRRAAQAFDEMQRLCRHDAVACLLCRPGCYGGGDPIPGLAQFLAVLGRPPPAMNRAGRGDEALLSIAA